MKSLFFRKGQGLADLALVIAVVGLIVAGMEIYIKRGVQAKVKAVTDHIISGAQSAGDAVDQTTNLDVYSGITADESLGGGRRYRTQDRVPDDERRPGLPAIPDRTDYEYDIPWHDI